MSSPGRVERETSAPSVHSPGRGKEAGQKDGDCQQPENRVEWTTTEQSENKDNGDIQEDAAEEEVSTSLSVGDGRHLVDLGRYADEMLLKHESSPLSCSCD
ncbi:Hypothetical protein SMAX5B_007288 [Scophthalmus maximus]|uniref:Uncharacterized protein n=1 Tax=Scophthalmus maximus TaxID=52904 RepID=A0A2U9BPE8_SCOMX|nr:Hypothetical protein SMAX5B_007288 [Scophthalmus maximus]